jgi:hypothetical protein
VETSFRETTRDLNSGSESAILLGMTKCEITLTGEAMTEKPTPRGRRTIRTISPIRLCCLSVVVAAMLLSSVTLAQARTVRVSSSGTLKFTKTHGSLIEATGSISGTLAGSLSVHISFNSNSRMTATFNGSFHGGKLSGRVGGEYYPSGSTTIYNGSATVSSGNGSYAHARAVGVHVSGTVNRSRRIVTIRLSGHLDE